MNVLRRYIRHGNTPVGCVVAVKKKDGIKVGYSFCSKKDHFSKRKGVDIAVNRACNGFHYERIPKDHYEEIIGSLEMMKIRANKYFKP